MPDLALGMPAGSRKRSWREALGEWRAVFSLAGDEDHDEPFPGRTVLPEVHPALIPESVSIELASGVAE